MFLSARSVCTIWGKAVVSPPAPAVAATGTVCVVGEHMWAYGPNTQHLDSKHVNQCHRRWRKWLLLRGKECFKVHESATENSVVVAPLFKKNPTTQNDSFCHKSQYSSNCSLIRCNKENFLFSDSSHVKFNMNFFISSSIKTTTSFHTHRSVFIHSFISSLSHLTGL